MSVAATNAPRALPVRALRMVLDLCVGAVLCMTPVTAIVAQGWLMRRMRVAFERGRGERVAPPGWLFGPAERRLGRLFAGLAGNVREGFSATVSLGLMIGPFAALWMFAWWAGWDNSFNKGYEQAGVGQTLFGIGILIFLGTMLHLPLALAHQAATGRWFAVFDWRAVRRVVTHAGWGHVWLALCMVLFAVPLFGRRGLPVFVEDVVPGFADFTPEQVDGLLFVTNLATAAYVFAGLFVLRLWSMRIYARALERAEAGQPRWRLGRGARGAALVVIWFGLVVLIVVGQFLNHSWWAWGHHPLYGVPWWG
ncbi:MAG: DUF4013 domain-containing protein [Pseudomonadota bacterium]